MKLIFTIAGIAIAACLYTNLYVQCCVAVCTVISCSGNFNGGDESSKADLSFNSNYRYFKSHRHDIPVEDLTVGSRLLRKPDTVVSIEPAVTYSHFGCNNYI